MNRIFRVAPDSCVVCAVCDNFACFDFVFVSLPLSTLRDLFTPGFAVAVDLADDGIIKSTFPRLY
jgi:hypothetical protein